MSILTRLNRLFEAEKPITSNEINQDGIGIVLRGGDLFKAIDNLPQNIQEQYLFNIAYEKFGLIAKIIDATTEQTVQDFFFKGPNAEKLEELRNSLNLDSHLFQVCKTMLKTGNCFVEVVNDGADIAKLKILPTDQMIVVRKKTGKVLAYIQNVGVGKGIVWGTIDPVFDEFKTGAFEKVGDINNIIHYMFNQQAGEKYGQSLIKPALRMLRIKDIIEGNLPIIIQRYLAPIIHVSVGDADAEPNKAQLETMSAKFKDIYADTEYITDFRTKMEVLGFKDKAAIDIKEIIDIIDKDIMMGMGMYPVLVGKGDTGDTKSAEVQLRAESRHIKSIQRILKTEFEDKFILGLDIGSEKDKLIWEMTDEREVVEKVANIVQLFNAGLLTRQHANDLLPKQFQEKLPEGDMVVNSTLDISTNPPTTSDTPNDPHQSTMQVDGQRVKKDDHRNPLDKQVKDTGKSKHEETK